MNTLVASTRLPKRQIASLDRMAKREGFQNRSQLIGKALADLITTKQKGTTMQTKTCPVCGDKLDPRGIGPHVRIKHGKKAFKDWQANGSTRIVAKHGIEDGVDSEPTLIEKYKTAKDTLEEVRAALENERERLQARLEEIGELLNEPPSKTVHARNRSVTVKAV